jgi:hypothetical protein
MGLSWLHTRLHPITSTDDWEADLVMSGRLRPGISNGNLERLLVFVQTGSTISSFPFEDAPMGSRYFPCAVLSNNSFVIAPENPPDHNIELILGTALTHRCVCDWRLFMLTREVRKWVTIQSISMICSRKFWAQRMATRGGTPCIMCENAVSIGELSCVC